MDSETSVTLVSELASGRERERLVRAEGSVVVAKRQFKGPAGFTVFLRQSEGGYRAQPFAKPHHLIFWVLPL